MSLNVNAAINAAKNHTEHNKSWATKRKAR